MAKATEYVAHPVLGTLHWLPEFSHWYVQLAFAPSGQLDLIVDPGDGDRHEFLSRAAELFQWAMVNERRVLADAMQARLLELYNNSWRQDGEPEMSSDALTAQLDWQLLTVSACNLVPVEYSYDAGELFGYHGVTIEVDAELQFRDIDLRG